MTGLLDPPRGKDTAQRAFDPFTRGADGPPDLRAAVGRPRLLTALGEGGGRPLVVVVAPAGYGKTTALSEWCRHHRRRCAWLTLDRRHDDPIVLLQAISCAVDEALAAAPDGRIALVLDDVHAVRSDGAHEVLAGLVRRPPEGFTIALASRAALPLPLPRLRAEGLVAELRPSDLALTRAEAAALCRRSGLHLDRESLDRLVRNTEGWPAVVSLAVLSLRRDAGLAPGPTRFDGVTRTVADYVREEVLAGLDPAEHEFVVRTSMLGVLSAARCDAILERSDSAAVLARLETVGFPLVALDRTGECIRHHRLLATMLQAELRRGPEEVAVALHRRASAWHAREGDLEQALRHALAARDVDRACDLVWAGVPGALERGSSARLEHWLSLFGAAEPAAHPRLALVAAGVRLIQGQGDVAEHWIGAAAAAGGDDTVAGGVALLRAALGRDGLARMRADARRASGLLAPGTPGQALCRLLTGVAEQLGGEPQRARATLVDAARGAAVAAPQLHALCLAQLALVAAGEQDGEESVRLAARARAQVERHGLERCPLSALVLAVSALMRARRGLAREASRDVRDAEALRERLVDLAPWYALEVELVLARAALRLSDVNGARSRLAEAGRLAARLPEAVTLHDWLHRISADVEDYTRAAVAVPEALTAAELRVLQYLPTHLCFRQIGEAAHLSANTVKTQANAVYRKLGVRSRSAAVECARALGLLED